MKMRPQSTTPISGSALRLPATLLVLLFLFLTSANAAIVTTLDHPAAKGATAISAVDCSTSEPALGHTHCQSPTFGIAGKSQFIVPVLRTSSSSVWSYAAVTCCPTPTHLRSLRPPKLFRVHV